MLRPHICSTMMVVLTLILVGGVRPVAAQDLSQTVVSNDGILQISLPLTYVSFDNTGDPQVPLLDTQLFWGQDPASLANRLAAGRSGILTFNVGMEGVGGFMGIIDAAAYEREQGFVPTAQGVVESFVAMAEASGGTITPFDPFMANSGMAYHSIVSTVPINDEVIYILAVESPRGILFARSSATSVLGQQEVVADTVIAIANSMTLLESAPQLVADAAGIVSIEIPDDWLAVMKGASDIVSVDTLVVGTTKSDIERSYEAGGILSGGRTVQISIYTFDQYYDARVTYVTQPELQGSMAALITSLEERGDTVLRDLSTFRTADGLDAALVGLTFASNGQGNWLMLVADNRTQTIFFVWGIVPNATEFDQSEAQMMAIFNSIRVPAAATATRIVADGLTIGTATTTPSATRPAQITPTVAGPTLTPVPAISTPENLPDGNAIFRTNDGSISIRLPMTWLASDQIAAGGDWVIADTLRAMQDRQQGILLTETITPMTGSGILIEVLSTDGVDNPTDIGMALLTEYADAWQANGGVILFPPAVLDDTPDTVIVTRVGGIHQPSGMAGFVALVVAPDAGVVLAIEATSSDADTFAANIALLEDAIRSIRVPAE